jgi:SAM-dependent methyltransferase
MSKRGAKRRLRRLVKPPWLGPLRRVRPLSETWGIERGTPVDRFYIERFLADHAADISGRMLEVGDARYATQFGREVSGVDVVDIRSTNTAATIVADLSDAEAIPANTFDCFVLTQTLQYVADVDAALVHVRRVLKPGGILLGTVPGLSALDRGHLDSDAWRFTPRGCEILFARAWAGDDVEVAAHGNVLAATAFLYGIVQEELSPAELAADDERFPVIVSIRAVKHA